MPKIRGIKPDYWTDEDIVDLSIPARLLFIGLWSYACDNGHLQDKPKQIKMRIFPGDDVSAAELLRELAGASRIMREDGWITIPNFTKHQRPDRRYFQTCDKGGCERPKADSQPETRGGHHETTTRPQRGHGVVSMGPHGDGDGDGERDGEGEVTASVAASAAPTTKPKRATRRPDDFKPSQAHVDLANERGVDLRAEWDKFCDWTDANGKTYKDWPAALRNWIRNARPSQQVANQPTRVQQHLALARQLAEEERAQMIPFPQIGEGR